MGAQSKIDIHIRKKWVVKGSELILSDNLPSDA